MRRLSKTGKGCRKNIFVRNTQHKFLCCVFAFSGRGHTISCEIVGKVRFDKAGLCKIHIEAMEHFSYNKNQKELHRNAKECVEMTKWLQRKLAWVSGVCLFCALTSGYAAVEPETGAEELLGEPVPVYVDGELEYTGYDIQGVTYVPLRSFCAGLDLGAVAAWNRDVDTMEVRMEQEGQPHTLTARVGEFFLEVNDRAVYLGGDVLSLRGTVLVPLQGLCGAFGITRTTDPEGVWLNRSALAVCPGGSQVYDPEALKWLSHIIHAEAGNQSMEGQICVGNVVLNRVADPRFPNTVQGVVFAPNQFCPVKSGTIYSTPDREAVAAAKLCLEGVNLAGQSTYFVNPVTGSTRWFRENLTYVMSVGEHDFYF